MYPKFLIFKLLNISNKGGSSIRKRLLRCTINKSNKEFQHVLKELSISENLLSKQLYTTDFYILKKSITMHNNKSLQKSSYAQQKTLSSLTRDYSYLYSQLKKLLLTSRNMNYPRKNPICLKQVYTFQSSQINFEKSKSLLPLKRFIVLLLTTLNPKKPKAR